MKRKQKLYLIGLEESTIAKLASEMFLMSFGLRTNASNLHNDLNIYTHKHTHARTHSHGVYTLEASDRIRFFIGRKNPVGDDKNESIFQKQPSKCYYIMLIHFG